MIDQSIRETRLPNQKKSVGDSGPSAPVGPLPTAHPMEHDPSHLPRARASVARFKAIEARIALYSSRYAH